MYTLGQTIMYKEIICIHRCIILYCTMMNANVTINKLSNYQIIAWKYDVYQKSTSSYSLKYVLQMMLIIFCKKRVEKLIYMYARWRESQMYEVQHRTTKHNFSTHNISPSSSSSSSSLSTVDSALIGVWRHLHQTLPALSVHRCLVYCIVYR